MKSPTLLAVPGILCAVSFILFSGCKDAAVHHHRSDSAASGPLPATAPASAEAHGKKADGEGKKHKKHKKKEAKESAAKEEKKADASGGEKKGD